jgi:hypothetical protein
MLGIETEICHITAKQGIVAEQAALPDCVITDAYSEDYQG